MITFGVLTHSISSSLKQMPGVNVIPMQGVSGASSTHYFINARSIQILAADGYYPAAEMLTKYQKDLDRGVNWADKGVRSAYHHYNPTTGAGLWKWPNACQKCTEYYKQARYYWLQARYAQAIFMLGAAVHLVQDLCVPHHATCNLFEGHLEYEKWAEKHKEMYILSRGGYYASRQTPAEWVNNNALVAMTHLALVIPNSPARDYPAATRILLMRAQRTTAGFFLYFFQSLPESKGVLI